MYKLNTATLIRCVSVALIASALACNKKDATVAADTSAMAPPPMPAPAAMRVTAVETGKGLNADKTIKDDAHDFGVRDTVYVSVKTEGAGSGKLAAKFTFQDGQTVNESSQDIAPTGDAYSEFHIQKATAWPKGDYKVLVTLNGDSVGVKDFTVK
jgi:hypothetical protein